MPTLIYKPIPKMVFGYSQERIVKHLKEHGESTGGELYKLSSKQSKPFKQLLEKRIIFKNENGRYQLRKEVQEFSDGISVWIIGNRKEKASHWHDIEDIPSPIKEELIKKGYYIQRPNDKLFRDVARRMAVLQ